ncbi:hypothetical protein U0O82_04470 [Fervidobacterium thailandense]|uniref:hypothetical protein n=1 Tax=Fervidobacterium thailandense TaxID=1008305 RepID=UPI00355C999E
MPRKINLPVLTAIITKSTSIQKHPISQQLLSKCFYHLPLDKSTLFCHQVYSHPF